MKIKTPVLLALAVLPVLCGQNAAAQDAGRTLPDGTPRVEVGIGGGGILYQGDLVPRGSAYETGSFQNLKGFGTLYGRYRLTYGLSVRAMLSIGSIEGDDTRFSDPAWRQKRAFNFTSPLQEFALLAEYNVLSFIKKKSGERWNPAVSSYVFAGAGLVRTNPSRDFSKVDAAYFGSEDPAIRGMAQDQANNGPRTSFVAPVGFGLRWDVSSKLGIFAEGGYRFVFSDDLDGFEHSVASSDADTYTMYSVGILLKLLPRTGGDREFSL